MVSAMHESTYFLVQKSSQGDPLLLSRLKIWCCHCCGSGHSNGQGSIPGLGTSTCHGGSQKRKKKKVRSREFPCNLVVKGSGTVTAVALCTAAVAQLQSLAWKRLVVAGVARKKRKRSILPAYGNPWVVGSTQGNMDTADKEILKVFQTTCSLNKDQCQEDHGDTVCSPKNPEFQVFLP